MARSRNNALEFSSAGSKVIADTDAVSGSFGAIQVIQDTVFNDLQAPNVEDVADLEGVTIGAGTVLYGNFTDIDLTSGLVIAHRV